MYQRASSLLNDPDAAKYLWGIGFHWYEELEWRTYNLNNVQLVSETFPGKESDVHGRLQWKFPLAGNTFNDWKSGEQLW